MRPVAKGKKRISDEEADAEAIAKFDDAVAKNVVRSEEGSRKRGSVPTKETITIMADEIQLFYEESGSALDYVNALDKALILWRGITTHAGATAKETVVPLVHCKKHR